MRSLLAGNGSPSDFSPPVLERRSPWLVRLFTRHVKRFYLARDFHAVRLSRFVRPEPIQAGPLIVVLNHPSWWDPLVAFVLAELFPERSHYAPMDSAALSRYRIFERLGVFGIEIGTLRGARDFIRTSCAILSRPQTALWITTQGRFADVRERPPGVLPGVAHLARRLQGAVILPLALEYPFWEERYPEVLARFGRPIVVGPRADRSVEEWRTCIEEALASTQDALASEAQRRDPAAFDTLVGGKAGIGGIYDRWRWLKACLFGTPFRAEHGEKGVLPAPGGPR
jgi:1-acyl-sn-glycerol-3-phosphate acyltransferase